MAGMLEPPFFVGRRRCSVLLRRRRLGSDSSRSCFLSRLALGEEAGQRLPRVPLGVSRESPRAHALCGCLERRLAHAQHASAWQERLRISLGARRAFVSLRVGSRSFCSETRIAFPRRLLPRELSSAGAAVLLPLQDAVSASARGAAKEGASAVVASLALAELLLPPASFSGSSDGQACSALWKWFGSLLLGRRVWGEQDACASSSPLTGDSNFVGPPPLSFEDCLTGEALGAAAECFGRKAVTHPSLWQTLFDAAEKELRLSEPSLPDAKAVAPVALAVLKRLSNDGPGEGGASWNAISSVQSGEASRKSFREKRRSSESWKGLQLRLAKDAAVRGVPVFLLLLMGSSSRVPWPFAQELLQHLLQMGAHLLSLEVGCLYVKSICGGIFWERALVLWKTRSNYGWLWRFGVCRLIHACAISELQEAGSAVSDFCFAFQEDLNRTADPQVLLEVLRCMRASGTVDSQSIKYISR